MSSNSVRCFICYKKPELGQIWSSIRTQCTAYTSTRIQIYLERLSDQSPLTTTDSELDNIVICDECRAKLNDYDLACSTARDIENDLRTLLNKSKELSTIEATELQLAIKEEDIEFDVAADAEPDNCDADHIDKEMDSESDEEKPLVHFKLATKPNKILDTIHTKAKNNSKLTAPAELQPKKPKGRPRIHLNRLPVVRRAKSDIPDSDVPSQLKCSICSLQVTTIVAYKRHLRTHYKAKERKFQCIKCRAKYTDQTELDAHIEKHKQLAVNNPLQCVECLKVFTSRNNLTRHLPIHTGEKLYVCELCGRGFIHYSSFREHKLIHANIRTKECPTCGRLFGQAAHLHRHLRTHTGEKPYTCTVCDRKFANKYNMGSHMKIHQQDADSCEKHVCIVCSRTFGKAVLLKGHMKRTHPQAMAEEMPLPL